jgi:molybdate transport system ATP-binding protein
VDLEPSGGIVTARPSSDSVRSLALDVELTAGRFTLAISESIASRAVAVVGPWGAGKTTLLEVIAGLRRPDRGRVAVCDHVLFDAAAGVDEPARRRRIGYVPQDLALFPHLDVRRNVLFGADRRAHAEAGRPERLTMERVIEVLDIGALLERRIETLSGGERQRVALARALLSEPDLLLLDEPLAALHTSLRDRILRDLQRVRDDLHMPLVYVSHDADEVRAIAEWVLILEAGRVVSSGRPHEVLPTGS